MVLIIIIVDLWAQKAGFAKISKIMYSDKYYGKIVQRPNTVPSSHSMCLDMTTEIILEPLMHLFFSLTRPMANHVLTKETNQLQGLIHFSNFFSSLDSKEKSRPLCPWDIYRRPQRSKVVPLLQTGVDTLLFLLCFCTFESTWRLAIFAWWLAEIKNSCVCNAVRAYIPEASD